MHKLDDDDMSVIFQHGCNITSVQFRFVNDFNNFTDKYKMNPIYDKEMMT